MQCFRNNNKNLKDFYLRSILEIVFERRDILVNTLNFAFNEIDNIHLVINGERFILKYKGELYPIIEDYQEFIFKKCIPNVRDVHTGIIPIMITQEDKLKIVSKYEAISNEEEQKRYLDVNGIYLNIDNYYKIDIKIDGLKDYFSKIH